MASHKIVLKMFKRPRCDFCKFVIFFAILCMYRYFFILLSWVGEAIVYVCLKLLVITRSSVRPSTSTTVCDFIIRYK